MTKSVWSYEPFSEQPEYLETNRRFIESLPLSNCQDGLDLACGMGILGEMMVAMNPALRIAGLDLSWETLQLARERLERAGRPRQTARREWLGLIMATADLLPIGDHSQDVIVIGNAIHVLPDPDRFLQDVYRVLRKGGLFAFNTSFFAGTYPEGTERFYHQWLIEALAYIASKDEDLRRNGRDGVHRRRGLVSRASAKPWRSAEDWQEAVKRYGFNVYSINKRTVIMNRRSFETVGAYAGLASVLLSGYPVDLACEALQAAAGRALAALAMESVPRLWLEMVAVKP
jgi:ubiquinone/menaquinone biosynthesis C-methylase UbiE